MLLAEILMPIKIEATKLTRKISKIESLIIGRMSSLIKNTAGLIAVDIQSRFSKEVDPSGKKWPLLTPQTIEDKFNKGFGNQPILVRTRRLRESIKSRRIGIFKHMVGSFGVEYADVHQVGSRSKNIPARPYIGVSDNARRNVKNLFIKEIAKLLRG